MLGTGAHLETSGSLLRAAAACAEPGCVSAGGPHPTTTSSLLPVRAPASTFPPAPARLLRQQNPGRHRRPTSVQTGSGDGTRGSFWSGLRYKTSAEPGSTGQSAGLLLTTASMLPAAASRSAGFFGVQRFQRGKMFEIKLIFDCFPFIVLKSQRQDDLQLFSLKAKANSLSVSLQVTDIVVVSSLLTSTNVLPFYGGHAKIS